MKKTTRTLVILGAVLVIIIGAYIAVSVISGAQARKTADAASASKLWSDGLGAPASISYTAGDKTLSFVLESGTWLVKDMRDFPLSQSPLTSLASALQSLSAVRTMDAAAPLSVYGLDKPAYTVTASDASSNAMTLLIGAENSGNYYAMVKDGEKIHTIAGTLVTSLKTDYLDLITLDTIPSFATTNIEILKLSDGKTSLTLDQHRNKDGTYSWFVVAGGTYTAADEFTPAAGTEKSAGKLISDASSAFNYMKFTSCAAWRPAEDALKLFGLDSPRLTVTVDYSITTGAGTLDMKTTEGSAALEIGTLNTDGSGYYARIPGSDQVNILPAEDGAALAEALSALGAG